MSLNDILQSDFLNNMMEFSLFDIVIALAVALMIGLFIFTVYKKTLNGVMYSNSFAMTVVGLCLVTTFIIMAVTSNVVLSIGMLGALSIVRFRAAIKEPIEIIFLFWALASGIIIGAGMIPLTLIGSLIIGTILILFGNRIVRYHSYLLMATYKSEQAEEDILAILSQCVDHSIVKSKTINETGIKLTMQLRTKDASTAFVNRITDISDVTEVTLISYNGDYMS